MTESWRATKFCCGHLPEGRHEVVGGLFWERCIERLHRFTYNTDESFVEVVSVSTMFMRDPHMRLKRKRLGLVTDLKEGRRERALAWPRRPKKETKRRSGLP